VKVFYIVTMNFQMLGIISNDRICRPTRWRHCCNNVVFEGYPLSQQSLSYRHDVHSPHRTDWIHSVLVKSATSFFGVMNYTAYLECYTWENDVADMDVMLLTKPTDDLWLCEWREGFTVVSRIVTFPDGFFPERRFPDGHFPGKMFPGW